MKEKERIEFRYYEVSKDFSLILLNGKRWEVPYGTDAVHFHNHLEIGICRYGDGNMHLGKEVVPYHDGTITVIPKNFLHHTKGCNDDIQKWEYLFIDSESFLLKVYKDKPYYANELLKKLHSRMFLLDSEESSDLLAVLDLIISEMEKKGEFCKENVCSLLLVLLLKIIQINNQEQLPEQKRNESANVRSVVDILNYVDLNYAKELRIRDLAKIANMSETHFRRIFTEYMNISPAEYINFIRIDKACALMRETDDRIEDIASKVGFPVATTFSRNFKKITGYSPVQWKMVMKKEDNVILDYRIPVLKGW